MAEAVVEYDYDREQEDELTLRVGDVIKNVTTAEGGWWEGELDGKKGMFPENFVKLRPKDTAKKEEKREATQRKSVRELANKFKDGVPMVGSVMQRKKVPEVKPSVKKCKVMFDYKPENEDELELIVGSIVDYHKEVEEGWWEGSVNGRTGVFPSNFVEMIEDGDGDQPADGEKSTTGEKEEAFHEIKGKKIMGVGLGNIFGGGPIKLRNTSKKPEPGKPKPEDKEAGKPRLPDSHPPDATKKDVRQTGERAVVRFSYVAEQPDELSLKEGDVIRVLDKNLEDEGWWRGEVNGKTGVFPDNFVELLPQQEEPVKAPKKPPPPSGKNLYPKLPDKAPAAAPVEDKPVLRKEQARRKSGLTKRRVMEYGEETGFDMLEPSSQKLMHLTANRAKGPKKRPPSTVLAPGDIDRPLEEEPPREHNHVHPEKPPHHKLQTSATELERGFVKHRDAHPTREHLRDASSTGPPPRPPEPRHELPPAESGSNTAALARLVEDLQREVRELRSHTVSKNDYNELRSELLHLKQDFEGFRAATSKKLRELMMEVDDEKKLRLNTQVEMERVKKLLAESQV